MAALARLQDWAAAEARFNDWPQVSVADDGTPVRRHPSWGDGVFERESGMVVSPIAYSVRRELRRKYGPCFGDNAQ